MKKVAIVTGGAAGIGAATCRRLAATGCLVIIADIDAAAARTLAAELEARGAAALAYTIDLGVRDEIGAMIANIVERFDGVDILVNNAAALDATRHDHAVAEIDPAIWDRQIAVNLTAPMLLSRAVIPLMIARGGGAIVHLASAAATRAEDNRTGYGTTKSALLALSRSIAVQYGKSGVRSNVVAPGLVLTPAAHATIPADVMDLFLDHHMTRRLGQPDDIAAAIAFLVSDDAAFITGAVLPVDGGFTSYLGAVPALRSARRSQTT